MTASHPPDWLAKATPCEVLDIRAAFRIFESLYVGPPNNFTPEQWRTRRVRLPVDELPLAESRLLVVGPDVRIEPVARYYTALLSAAASHGRALEPSSLELSVKPRVLADSAPLCEFPWTDTYTETQGVFSALIRDADGELFADIDQHWEVAIFRCGDSVLFGERDWETNSSARTAAAPSEMVAGLATRASAELQAFVVELQGLLGRSIWLSPVP